MDKNIFYKYKYKIFKIFLASLIMNKKFCVRIIKVLSVSWVLLVGKCRIQNTNIATFDFSFRLILITVLAPKFSVRCIGRGTKFLSMI